jgi:hypothetical protein
MQAIIDFFLKLLGLKSEDGPDVEWVKEKIKGNNKKLEEIENEEHSLDDLNDHFNK